MNSLCALISCLSFLPVSFFLVHTFPNPGTLGKQIKASPGGFYKLHEAHGRTPGMKHWARFMTSSEAQIESVKWRGLLAMACSRVSQQSGQEGTCVSGSFNTLEVTPSRSFVLMVPSVGLGALGSQHPAQGRVKHWFW